MILNTKHDHESGEGHQWFKTLHQYTHYENCYKDTHVELQLNP